MERFIACTYGELQEANKKGNEEFKEKLIRETDEAIDKIPDKIKRGMELIYPFRVDDWAVEVVKSAVGVDRGSITDCVIEIIEAIEYNCDKSSILEFFSTYKKNHSEEFANSVRNLVLEFSYNGYPFYEATHGSEEWTIDECKKVLRIMCENEEMKSANPEVFIDREEKQKVLSRMKRLQELETKRIN